MRFGGNIGVHAINRTSGAPLNNPSQQLLQQPGVGLGAQGMGGMGGLNALGGINNPLAGLPGASRPAVRPPSWQRAQALAQQAAQAQAQQQVGEFDRASPCTGISAAVGDVVYKQRCIKCFPV